MRQRFDEEELRNLLLNAHGIDVRLWVVNLGAFEGVVFDSDASNADWKDLVKENER